MRIIRIGKLVLRKTKEKGIRFTLKRGTEVIKGKMTREVFNTPSGANLKKFDEVHPIMKGAIAREEKVAIIIGLEPYYFSNGNNRNALLAKGLNRNGYKVIYYYLCEDDMCGNVFLYQEDCCKHKLLQLETIAYFEYLCSKADILICSAVTDIVIDYLKIAFKYQVETILDVQEDWFNGKNVYAYNKKNISKIISYTNRVTAPNNRLMDNFKSNMSYEGECLVLRNGCEPNIFEVMKNNPLPIYFIEHKYNYVIHYDFKEDLLDWDLIKQIAQENSDVGISIVGNIPVWIRESNGVMPSNILYLGEISRIELAGLIAKSDGVLVAIKKTIEVAYDSTQIEYRALVMNKRVIYSGITEISIPENSVELAGYNLCSSPAEVFNEKLVDKNSVYTRVNELLRFTKNEIKKSEKKISIIILNYNNKNVIFKCIDKLLYYNTYNYEIIVVDNGSSDGSYETLCTMYKNNDNVKMVKNTKNGCSSGRNFGAKHATGDTLVFFDSDQWPFSFNWLDEPLKVLETNKNIGIIGWAAGWLHFNLPNIVGGIVDGLFGNVLPTEYSFTTSIDYLGSGGMILDAQLFKSIGGFDEFYDPTAFEDTDLSYRVKKAGKQIAYTPYINIYHLGNQTTRSNDATNTKFHEIFNRNMQYFRKKWGESYFLEDKKSYKIVFVNRSNMFTHRGGDTVQILKTREFLMKNYDIDVRICTSPEEMLLHKDADLFHIFNIQTLDFTERAIATAINLNKPVALSPIFWELGDGIFTYYLQRIGIYNLKPWMYNYRNFIVKLIGSILGEGYYYSQKYINRTRWMLENANIILPNSQEEMEIIQKKFNITNSRYRVVPNAIDNKVVYNRENSKIERKNNRVLVSGRIETVKNQYMLLKALYNHKDIEIVFLGRLNNHKYYEKLKALSEQRGNVIFVDEVPNDKVYEYYLSSKVHVLASFRESPGLSTLEAAYYGCNVVFADDRFTPVEYYEFNQLGFACNPYSEKSIEEAVLKALNTDVVFDSEAYFSKFSYDTVAEETYLGYCSLIDRGQE